MAEVAEVNPIFKKNGDLDKENYRSVSVLSHMLNVFERIMYTETESFVEDKLSKFLVGFRKNHSTHYCLINTLEKWGNTLDKGGFVCVMFIDLSKAFDTMNHDLLIAKLGAYGFQKDAFSFHEKLFNEKTTICVNSKFNMWERTISGGPQGSMLGRLLF